MYQWVSNDLCEGLQAYEFAVFSFPSFTFVFVHFLLCSFSRGLLNRIMIVTSILSRFQLYYEMIVLTISQQK